jgi:succinate-semialdehyde dehydrogenase/glutarate-semialdehyde dehydrogenase
MNVVEPVDVRLFIDGVWRPGARGRVLAVADPATGQSLGQLACADDEDLDYAAHAAHAAHAGWSETPASERARLMRGAAAQLRQRAAGIGPKVTAEQGKPVAESVAETVAAAELLEWFADESMRVYGRIVPTRETPDVRHFVIKVPVGPVAAFTPWNFPLTQVARKVGPALAAGCTVVLKAPEETPSGPAELVRAFADAGLPPGVLNLVFGDPPAIADRLIEHPLIRKLTFTGSTVVGKLLAEKAGRHMKRATMELGGHAPVIVAEDADVEVAVRAIGAAKFRNAGQICIAPSRFLVHRSIARAFGEQMAAAARAIVVGHGLQAGTQMGPVANARRLAAMRRLTDDALQHGARLLSGGEQIGSAGHFWQPTVLADVGAAAQVMNEEPFGPIVAIRPFDTLEEALAEANRLPFGLAGYAFTRSMKTAGVLSRRLRLGMLWINTAARAPAELPFGGVNDSGHGSEGGPEALLEYLSTRTVTVREI